MGMFTGTPFRFRRRAGKIAREGSRQLLLSVPSTRYSRIHPQINLRVGISAASTALLHSRFKIGRSAFDVPIVSPIRMSDVFSKEKRSWVKYWMIGTASRRDHFRDATKMVQKTRYSPDVRTSSSRSTTPSSSSTVAIGTGTRTANTSGSRDRGRIGGGKRSGRPNSVTPVMRPLCGRPAGTSSWFGNVPLRIWRPSSAWRSG